MTSLLLAVLFAAPPMATKASYRVQVINAVLHAPSSDEAVGRVSNVEVTLGAWSTATAVAFRHENPSFRVDARLDLADEGTFVEVRVPTATRLEDTGPWTVIATPEAKLALLGNGAAGWRLGFPASRGGPVRLGTLSRASPKASVPRAGETLPCLDAPVQAEPRAGAPGWTPDLTRWTVSRVGGALEGWQPVRVEAGGVVVVASVPVTALECDAPPLGGLGFSGSASASDSLIFAREATLAVGTRFFAQASDEEPVAELRVTARALQTEDGHWRVPEVKHGAAALSLHSVLVLPEPTARVSLPKQVGVGSVFSPRPEWPRLVEAPAPSP